MLNRLKQQVGDLARQVQAVAGRQDLLPVEAYRKLWRLVQDEHESLIQRNSNSLDDPHLLANTNIPENLDAMVCILIQEDLGIVLDSNSPSGLGSVEYSGRPSGPLRACLEFTMEHKVFEGLYTLASMDTPKGMSSLVLKMVQRIVEKVRHPLVPYKNAHSPLRQLVHLVNEVGDESCRINLVLLLESIWYQIREDAPRVQAFYEVRGGLNQLDIFTSLLPHVVQNSPLGAASRRTMIIVSSVGEPTLQKFVADSEFPRILCEGLRVSFLSRTTSNQESQKAKGEFLIELWRFYCAVATPIYEYLPIDQVLTPIDSNNEFEDLQKLSVCLLQTLQTVFFEDTLNELLMVTSESVSCAALSCVCDLLEIFVGTEFQSPVCWKFVSFLINTSCLDDPDDKPKEDSMVQKVLVSRLDSMSPIVSARGLAFFSCLLELDDPRILHCLVLRNLYNGNHLLPSMEDNNDAMKTPVKKRPESSGPSLEFLNGFPGSPKPPAYNNRKSLSEKEVEDLVSFESYLTDGQQKAAAKLAAFSSPCVLHLSRIASPARCLNRKSLKSQHFEESEFMNLIMNKLERLLDTSFQENLQLTAIIATLAQCPHALLHSYIYDTEISAAELEQACEGNLSSVSKFSLKQDSVFRLRTDVRSVSRILSSVWTEAAERAEDMGQGFESHRMAVVKALSPDASDQHQLSDLYSETRQSFVQAYVVLEEFLKELSSILQAKQNLAFLQTSLVKTPEND